MVDDIIEPVCRLIKHSMRALGQAFTQYLNVFLKKAMEGYQKNAIGSFVYTVEFSMSQYGHEPEFSALFKEAFEYICSTTEQILATQKNCERNPELVNDFFGLCKRYIRHNRVIFYQSTTLEILMKGITMNAIGVEQVEAVQTHSQFFIDLIKDVVRVFDQGYVNEVAV